MLKQRIWQQPLVRTIAAISLGAIAGALCRYYLGLTLNSLAGIAVPYSTLVINITGCFAMGFLVTLSLGRVVSLHPDVWLLLLTGFLGHTLPSPAMNWIAPTCWRKSVSRQTCFTGWGV